MKRTISVYAMRIVFGLLASTLATGPMPAFAQHADHNAAVKDSKPGIKSEGKGSMGGVSRLAAKRVLTVKGDEDWDELTGFGKDSSMAEMMTLMMVGGSGMEHMRMAPMKPGMKMGDMKMALSQGMPVTVTPNPPIVGDNKLDVVVTDIRGKPVTGLKLSAAVAMTSMDMGTARPKAIEGKDGRYAFPVTFSMKGPWRVTLTVQVPKQRAFTKSFEFNVKK
jgi:hypothetical protein